MGLGVWGLGFGVWGLGPTPKTPIPNPQSPIPKTKIFQIKEYKYFNNSLKLNIKIKAFLI